MNIAKVLLCIEEAMIHLGYANQDEHIKEACKALQEAHDEITEKYRNIK